MMKRMFLIVTCFLLFISNSYGQRWKQYIDSAEFYSGSRQPDKILAFHIKAREELKKDSANTKTYATCTNLLGSDYLDLAEYEKAKSLFLEAKEIREKISGKTDTVYASSCFNLGLVYKRMNQYEQAESFYLEAKQRWENIKGKENLFYARICNNLGNLYTDLDQYEKAEQLLYQSKTIREKITGKDDPAYAQSILNLATLYENMTRYEKAEPLLLEAKQIREKKPGRESSAYAQACDNLGHLYLSLGQFKRAEPLFLEARQLWEKTVTKKHPDYALATNHLGLTYMNMAEYEKAEPLFLEAKQIREKVNNKSLDYSWSCDNLAEYYKVTGQYEKAEPLFLESKQIREKIFGKNHSDYVSACENLGNLYFEMRYYERAEPLYREALEIRQNSNNINKSGIAYSYMNIGNVLSSTGEYEKAGLLYQEAREISGKVKGRLSPEYANSCYNLAGSYLDRGEYAQAAPLFLETMEIRKVILGKNHPDYSQSLLSLAVVYSNLKNYEKVNEYYDEALEIQSSQWNKLLRFTNEAEQQAYLKKRTDPVNLFLSFATSAVSYSKQELVYNTILSNRNLLLLSSEQLRQSVYNSDDTAVRNKYNSWINKREQLSFWLSKPLAERPDYMKELETNTDLLEKELFSLSADFREQEQRQKISWQDIQQSLKQGEAAIEFVDFQFCDNKRWTDSTYYIAFVLRKDKTVPEMVKLFEKRVLDAALLATKSIDEENTMNFRFTKDNQLYKIIWQPLEKKLEGIDKIYFAPSGLLHKIPLPAIAINNAERLSDKYKMTQVNTTAAITRLQPEYISASNRLVLYGGIFFDGDTSAFKQAAIKYTLKEVATRSLPEDPGRGEIFQYVPESRTEVENIKKMAHEKNIPADLFTGWEATEESVKLLGGANSPYILHIATHGFFFKDPKIKKSSSIAAEGRQFIQSDDPLLRAGLAMAGVNFAWNNKPVKGIQDGILTAYEISNLYLPNTKLTVLSACETGLGDIKGSEGVYGLQRAFKIAGAKNLVMSLWNVPDAETAGFMTEFYKKMFTGQSIEDAFYNTQTVMKNKYRNEPFKWAAWILVR